MLFVLCYSTTTCVVKIAVNRVCHTERTGGDDRWLLATTVIVASASREATTEFLPGHHFFPLLQPNAIASQLQRGNSAAIADAGWGTFEQPVT
jgi:hypothetical protein